MKHHLKCMSLPLAGLILGFAYNAWAQQQIADPAVPASTDPVVDLLLRLISGGGLPSAVAIAAWLLRSGVPVRLSDEDRRLLAKKDPE